MEDQRAPAATGEDITEEHVQRRLDEQLETLDLYGIAELSERWRVSKQRADEIASTRLGAPWRVLKMGRVWNKKQVQEFEKTWERKSGRHITPWK